MSENITMIILFLIMLIAITGMAEAITWLIIAIIERISPKTYNRMIKTYTKKKED